MKPTTINIDGVRYLRAGAIESEIAALDKATAALNWHPIPDTVWDKIYASMRRLRAAVERPEDPADDTLEQPTLDPRYQAYPPDFFTEHMVAGRGLMLETEVGLDAPPVGRRFYFKGALYEVQAVETGGPHHWAVQVKEVAAGGESHPVPINLPDNAVDMVYLLDRGFALANKYQCINAPRPDDHVRWKGAVFKILDVQHSDFTDHWTAAVKPVEEGL